VDPEFGLSGRWGITPNVKLNATLNPDFSQVEADVAQLEVNERFALSYPEKRAFFLEGADLFQTPTRLVFTRSIVDPVGGVKLSGKEGKNVFGVFAASDRVTSLLIPANQGSAQGLLQEEVHTGVARYRRDIGRSSTVGATYTGRVGEGYFNHVAAVDGFLRLSPSNFVRAQLAFSGTEYPDTVVRAFRQSDDARYVALTAPRILVREPYGSATVPIEAFNYEERVDGTDHGAYLWGNSTYALAANINKAFALYGWCASIRGVESGGLVEGLPVHRPQHPVGNMRRPRRMKELVAGHGCSS